MRHACLCTITAVILLVSCSKNNASPDSLYGNWLYLERAGGFAGGSLPSPSGTRTILSLNQNGSFQQWTNRTITGSGTWSVKYVRNGGPGPDSAYALIFGNDEQSKLLITLQHDTLLLSEDAYDGFEYIYKKLH